VDEYLREQYLEDLSSKNEDATSFVASEYAQSINDLINDRPPTDRAMLLHRGVKDVSWMGGVDAGDRIQFSGFVSTSSDESNKFSGIHIILMVPKGMNDVLFTANGTETEVILNHETVGTLIYKSNNRIIIAMDPEGDEASVEKADWDESKHPREPAGSEKGGEFTSVAEDLLQHLVETQGFTYQPILDKHIESGYILSIYPDDGVVIDRDVTKEDIREYLTKHKERFKDQSIHAGGWFDTESGKVYLDLSVVTNDFDEAIKLSVLKKQKAFFDRAKMETVYVRELIEGWKDKGKFATEIAEWQREWFGKAIRALRYSAGSDRRGLAEAGGQAERHAPKGRSLMQQIAKMFRHG